MNLWLRTVIFAGSLAATVAIALASAAIYGEPVAPKSDRLTIAAETSKDFVTVETRGQGVSVLNRLPADTASN